MRGNLERVCLHTEQFLVHALCTRTFIFIINANGICRRLSLDMSMEWGFHVLTAP